jgi:hypothetical protein
MAERNSPESFIRWQAITRDQLSFSSNLILTLSVAALGYQLDLLNREPNPDKCHIGLGIVAAIALTASVLLGIGLVVNRLLDFKLTKDVARRRDRGASDADLADDRAITDRRGKRTWCLFWWQTGTFAFGSFLTAATVMVNVLAKLP